MTTPQQLQIPQPSIWDNYDAAIQSSTDYGVAEKDALLWLTRLARRDDLSLTAAADLIGYSKSALQRVVTGTYGTDATGVITAILQYKTSLESDKMDDYIHTSTGECVWSAAEKARKSNRIVQLVGLTQRGKTRAIKAYAEKMGNLVVLVRCPTAPTQGRILREITRVMGLSGGSSADQNMDYIRRHLTKQHLLVIDEIHQLTETKPINGRLTVETIREIYERCECGVLLIGTNIWRESYSTDRKWKGLLEQTIKRGRPIVLPDKLPVRDLRSLWQHYGLPEPPPNSKRQLKAAVNQEGLGIYTQNLMDGYTYAVNKGIPYTWDVYFSVVASLEKYAAGQTDEDDE